MSEPSSGETTMAEEWNHLEAPLLTCLPPGLKWLKARFNWECPPECLCVAFQCDLGCFTALSSEWEGPKNPCLEKARQKLLKSAGSEVTYCPFHHTPLVKAVASPVGFKGRAPRPSFPQQQFLCHLQPFGGKFYWVLFIVHFHKKTWQYVLKRDSCLFCSSCLRAEKLTFSDNLHITWLWFTHLKYIIE